MDNLKKYLPSKKFLVILSSVVFAFVIIFATKILIDNKEENAKKIATATKNEITLREKFLAVDSDSDGLKDWEEALWGTNPKVADTDGDRTSDGQEIKEYRDPLKAGPDDKFSTAEIAETKKVMDEYASLNETEKFSRTVFSNFLATQQIDAEMSDADIESFVENALTNIPEKKDIKKHTLQELTIIDEPTDKDFEDYLNTLANILMKDFLPFVSADTETFQKAINEDDPNQMKVLEKSIESYKKVITLILTLKTPNIYAEDHLNILNSLEEITSYTTDISNYFNDQILAIPAINSYPIAITNLETSLQSIGLLAK